MRPQPVTLDLNGHLIDGDGTPDTSCNPHTDFCDFGVGFENHDGITVKHGSIRQFEGGLGAFETRRTRLLGLATSRNHFSGIGLAGDARVLVVIARNSNRDTEESGITVDFVDTPVVGNVVRRNHIRGAGKDGDSRRRRGQAHPAQAQPCLRRERRRPRHNSSATKLTGNEASRNGDLGIEAVRGVIDGGGNEASGNGDPRQCMNIACK